MKLVSDQRNRPIEGLTHSDDICVRLVHSNVIFGCPMHTNCNALTGVKARRWWVGDFES